MVFWAPGAQDGEASQLLENIKRLDSVQVFQTTLRECRLEFTS